jgi:hypothetical protein
MSSLTLGMAPSRPAVLGGGASPDRLTLWPLDDGRYGLDAAFHGAWACEDAERVAEQLTDEGMAHALRPGPDGAWTVRAGPLSSLQVARALDALVDQPAPAP